MRFASAIRAPVVLAHAGVPGSAAFVAVGLFLTGAGAALGAYWVHSHPPTVLPRAAVAALATVAAGCLLVGTIYPVLVGARPSLSRPSTTGQLEIVSPQPDQRFQGDPASIPVALRLNGANVVAFSSLRLVPNEGHIHLYLDGSLVSMTTGLTARITATPGSHELRAEFVAIDHLPFDPPVIATVTFSVQG